MADPRELLARLNATTVRFDTGMGGGGPSLANIDVAHALGLVPPGLGREVLECCFLDHEVRISQKIRFLVLGAVMKEWRRQDEALVAAKLDLNFNQAMVQFSNTTSAALRRSVESAQAAFDEAKAECWPREAPTMVAQITLAALQEIAGSSACDNCHGHRMVPCTRCAGAGYVSWSDRTRAHAINRSQPSFHNNWSGMYLWILAMLRDAEYEATNQLSRALSTKNAA